MLNAFVCVPDGRVNLKGKKHRKSWQRPNGLLYALGRRFVHRMLSEYVMILYIYTL